MAHVRRLDWPDPTASPLDRISPSALIAFEQCPKRLAYQRDDRTRAWLRRSTRSALGVIAHTLTEEVGRGATPAPPARKAWLENRWDELISEQFRLLTRDWPGRPVPDPVTWRGYVATRTRLLRRLESLDAPVAHPSQRRAVHDGRPLPWVEVELSDVDSGIFGTPDRVEMRDGLLRVVDLKSGVHQQEMTASQRRQLLMYAHLVFTTLGQRPDLILVQDARGKEYAEEAPAAEVAEAVEAARMAMSEFNAMVSTGRVDARPGQEQCGYCEFRVVCADYWDTRDADWYPFDVKGSVDRVDLGVIILESSGLTATAISRVILAEGATASPGDEITVVDLDRAGPGTGRMRWDSRMRPYSVQVNGALAPVD